MATETKIDAAPAQSSLTTLAAQAAGMLAVLTLITGVAYPLVVTGIAKVAFPDQANGSLIVKDQKVVGSALIGQPFEDPKHFWSRLSATTPGAYNAASSMIEWKYTNGSCRLAYPSPFTATSVPSALPTFG